MLSRLCDLRCIASGYHPDQDGWNDQITLDGGLETTLLMITAAATWVGAETLSEAYNGGVLTIGLTRPEHNSPRHHMEVQLSCG